MAQNTPALVSDFIVKEPVDYRKQRIIEQSVVNFEEQIKELKIRYYDLLELLQVYVPRVSDVQDTRIDRTKNISNLYTRLNNEQNKTQATKDILTSVVELSEDYKKLVLQIYEDTVKRGILESEIKSILNETHFNIPYEFQSHRARGVENKTKKRKGRKRSLKKKRKKRNGKTRRRNK